MEERFLPIGTVVTLKGADKKVMITDYIVFSGTDKDAKTFDYGSCPFPTGVKRDVTIGFNHKDIEKVVFMGYQDDEQKKLSDFLNENEEKIKNEIKEKMSNK